MNDHQRGQSGYIRTGNAPIRILAVALLGGALLLSATRLPAPPPPLYALAAVHAGLLRAPGRWLGRTVRLRAVAGSPCVSWMGGVTPVCISWQPALLDPWVAGDAGALPLRAVAPLPLLAALRRLPLAGWLVGVPQQIRWGALTTYVVRLQAAPVGDCGIPRCYDAMLLDAASGGP